MKRRPVFLLLFHHQGILAFPFRGLAVEAGKQPILDMSAELCIANKRRNIVILASNEIVSEWQCVQRQAPRSSMSLPIGLRGSAGTALVMYAERRASTKTKVAFDVEVELNFSIAWLARKYRRNRMPRCSNLEGIMGDRGPRHSREICIARGNKVLTKCTVDQEALLVLGQLRGTIYQTHDGTKVGGTRLSGRKCLLKQVCGCWNFNLTSLDELS